MLREMLISKAGRDFAINAIDNVDNCVSERVSSSLFFRRVVSLTWPFLPDHIEARDCTAAIRPGRYVSVRDCQGL